MFVNDFVVAFSSRVFETFNRLCAHSIQSVTYITFIYTNITHTTYYIHFREYSSQYIVYANNNAIGWVLNTVIISIFV